MVVVVYRTSVQYQGDSKCGASNTTDFLQYKPVQARKVKSPKDKPATSMSDFK
jgi:hypothetical protein